MKKGYQFLLCLLAVGMTASTLLSCGNEAAPAGGNDTQAAGNDVQEAETEPLDARKAIADELPAYDAGGATFTINCDANDLGWLYVEEENGDIVDDAIFRRNSTVSERFNVNFEYVGDLGYSDNANRITQSIKAGDDEYALCCTHAVNTCILALQDFFINWYDVPHVNFSKPWWAASTTEDLSYNGVCVLAVGDYVLNALSCTYCMVYNKNLADDYDLGDIYQIVNDGKWTLEKMVSLNKDIYQDLNGNGVKDDEDFFGMTSDGRSNMETYLWCFGKKIISKDSSGTLALTYYDEKTVDIINKLCAAFHDNQGLRVGDGWWYGIHRFEENQTIFANASIDSASGLRDLQADYGIIPYPKWDEAQDRYYTMVDGAHGVLSIPTTCSDLERTGIIIEALNAEGYKTVTPTYYETALKEKYARDAESIAMLDMIVASRVFDMGYIFDGWKGTGFYIEKLVPKNDSNLASLWSKNEKAVTKHYQEVIDFFLDYEDNH